MILPTQIFAQDVLSNDRLTIIDYSDNNNGDYRDSFGIESAGNSEEVPVQMFSLQMLNAENTNNEQEIVLLNSQETKKRDIILLLDISDSMEGNPLIVMKQAAIKFCNDLLGTTDDNRIALVVWDYDYTIYDFSDDIDNIKSTINSISLGAGTKTDQALKVAKNLMDTNGRDNSIKNIVLMTDGLPTYKQYSYDGPYTSEDYSGYWNDPGYECANSAYAVAHEIMENYHMYTLGFFHSLTGDRLSFGRRFLTDIQNAGYYEVINSEDLEFVFGDVANDITNAKLRGTFNYQSGANDYSATFYYDDDYFTNSSYIYNPSLSTMSMCLAMSAFGSSSVGNDYTKKSKNANDLLTKCGFTNYKTNSYLIGGFDNENKPTTDSIGVAGASKKIKDGDETYTLIAVAVRGSGYESEWTSNFTLGSSGQHQGFREAKENVLRFIDKYVNDNNIEGKVKIWVTGYSRAAATSNIVGAALDDGSARNYISSIGETISYSSDDIFTYCFETPAGGINSDGLTNSVYNNIYNIINPNDPVPKVAPAAMNFGRYGIDRILPTNENDAYYSTKLERMLEQYNGLDSTDSYTVDDFQMKKIAVSKVLPGGESPIQDDTKNNYSQSVFLDDFINRLVKEFLKTRNNYVTTYQSDIRYISSTFFGASGSQTDKLIESLKNKFTNNWWDVVSPLLSVNPFKSAEEKEKEAYAVVAKFMKESLADAGIAYNEDEINEAVQSIADLLVAYVLNHPNLTTTLICNIEGIGSAHYPELCFAWLRSMDPNYISGAGESFSTGNYRVIHINCPIDVTVKDEEGNIVACISNDIPQSIENSSIISAINEDGEKIVILPSNAEYDIDLQATADGTMSYSINEYDAMANDTVRLTGFFDVEINSGDVLNSNIPQYSAQDLENGTINGSSSLYTLTNNDGENIVANINLTGEDATNAYYMVQLQVNNDAYGTVIGQGVRQEGNYAQLEATPNEGCAFVGWYDGTTLLSTEQTYRFRVEKDITIIANFESDKASVSFISDNNVFDTIDVNENNVIENIPTPTKSGYIFEGWFTDENYTSEFTSTTIVTSDISVYAKWRRQSSGGGGGISSYTIKFETNGGSKVSNKSVRRNNTLTEPTAPTKDGFTFEGWYTDKELTNAYDFAQKVTKGFALYAKWADIKKSQIILTISDKAALVFGEIKENDVAPKIVKDRTMLPIRFIAEALGAEVIWTEAEPDKVLIKKDNIEIIINIGSDTALVNGKKIELDSPAFIENDRTYLPLRFVSENLGAKVDWVENTQQVIITK